MTRPPFGQGPRPRRGGAGPQALAAPAGQLGLADGALLAQRRPAPDLAGLLVMLPLAQLLLQPAALDQLLEAAQGRTDRLPVMNAHPQRHELSLKGSGG